MIKILAIENSKEMLVSLQLALTNLSSKYQLNTTPHHLDSIPVAIADIPDIIIMNLDLCAKDKFEIINNFKTNEQLNDIPIACLYSENKNRLKAIENGVDAFIYYPLNNEELNLQLQLLLNQKSGIEKVKENVRLEKELLRKAKEKINLLEENVKGLKNIFDSMSEGFSIQDVICDEKGNPIDLRFIEANPAFEKQTGLINSETLGHTLLELFPTSEKYWIERYGKVGITGEPISFEAMFGPLNIFYHVNAFQIGQRQFGVLFTDINDRKLHEVELTKAKERAEESESNLKRGQQIAKMGFWTLHAETMEVSCSEELLEIFEIEGELKLDSFINIVHPEDKEMDLAHIKQGLEQGKAWDIEHRLLFEKGRIKWIHVLGEPQMDDSNSVSHIIGTVQDITERKAAEELIIKNKNRLDFSLKSVEIGAWELDLEKQDSWRSLKHDQIFGYNEPLDVWTYDMFLEHVIPEHRKEVHNKFQHALESKSAWNFECKINKNNGEIRWIWAKGVQEFSDQYKKGKMFGIVQDITDRKNDFNKVLESEEKFKSLMHQSPFVVELYNLDGLQISVNKAYEELWKFPAETTVNKFNILKSKEVIDTGLISYVEQAYAGEAVDVPIYRFDPTGDTEAKGEGRVRWLSTRIYPIKNQQDIVQNIVIVHMDVTDQKLSEKELNKSLNREKLMADIVRESSVGIAIGYPGGKLGMCNSAFQDLTGYNEEELKTIDWNFILTPEEWRATENAKLEELHQSKKSVQYEKEYIRKDGSRVPIQLLVHPRFGDNGDVKHYIGFILDITERKAAEERIAFQANLLETVEQAVIVTDTKGIVIYWNPFAEKLYGWPSEDAIGQNIVNVTVPKVSKNQAEEIMKQLSEGNSWSGEFDVQHRDGSVFPAFVTDTPFHNDKGELIAIIGTSTDITERKLAETKLKDSQNNLSAVFNSTQDAQILSKYIGEETFIVDSVNNSYIDKLELLGIKVSKEDLIGKSLKTVFTDFLHLSEDVYNYTIDFYLQVIESKKPINYDESIEINHKNYHSETSYSPIYNLENGTTYVLYSSHDITAEKDSIDLVQKSEQRYKNLFNNSPIPLWEEDFTKISLFFDQLKKKGVVNIDEHFAQHPEDLIKCVKMVDILDVNQSTLELHKADSKDQLIGNLDKTFTEKSLDIFKQELNVVFESKNSYQSEAEVKTLDGELLYINIVLKLEKDSNGRLRGLLATTNITERKIAEVLLKESESNLTALINNTDDSVWSLDKDFKYLIYNKTYAEIFKNSYGLELNKGIDSKKQLSEEEYQFWVPLFDAALKGEKQIFEFTHVFNEVNHHFQTSLNPIFEGDTITGVSARSVDISERRESENKINMQLNDLRRWHKAMLNREERTMELKQEVNDLLQKLDLPKKYGKDENE